MFTGRLYRFLIAVATVMFAAMPSLAQINADQVMKIGQNTLYFEDYVLSIQYFNQAIGAKPYLAQPYFYRAVAKLNLEDYKGAEADASLAIDRNPFITDAYEVRGVARQNLGKFSEAVGDYDKALETVPESRGLLYNKALAQEEMGDYDGAEATFGQLLKAHPSFDGGYIGRAKLSLARKDTVAARNDIEKSLSINPNSVNGYVMRADIAINSDGDFKQALADMDMAIKLQPQYAGFFINRAFLRYKTDDYFGAMADYDYALSLEPLNTMALYNRALLRAEVHDTNNAIRDLNQVLKLNKNDYRALFNRAILYREIGEIDDAIADLDRLLAAFPDFSAAYFLRFELKKTKGDRTAEKDYRKSLDLAKKRIDTTRDEFLAATDASDEGETQEQVEARFTSLITIDDNAMPDQVFNSKEIKGRVQDRNINVELEPLYVVTYYTSPTELRPGSEYLREITDINDSHILRFSLQIVNHPATSTDEDVFETHSSSIDYYNSYLSTHTPRSIDYFGRAMDFVTLRNYERAVADLSRAISLTPDFTLAYFVRGCAYAAIAESSAETENDAARISFAQALTDFDKVLELSPKMALAYYNKGVIHAMIQDFTSALAAFNKAIELDPEMGDSYFNRGYTYLRLGNREAGMADLSKAGELGVVQAYNLLKRMGR